MPKAAAAMTVSCPNCQASYKVSDKQMGKKLRCQKCGRVFRIGEDNVAPAKSKTSKTSKTAASGKTGKTAKTSKSGQSSKRSRPESSKQARPESSKQPRQPSSKRTAAAPPKKSKTGKAAAPKSSRRQAAPSGRQAAPSGRRERPQSSKRQARPDSGRQSSRRQQPPPQAASGRRSGRAKAPAMDEAKSSKRARIAKNKKGQGKLMLSAGVAVACVVLAILWAIRTPTKDEFMDDFEAKWAAEQAAKEKAENATGTTGGPAIKPIGDVDEKLFDPDRKKNEPKEKEPDPPKEKQPDPPKEVKKPDPPKEVKKPDPPKEVKKPDPPKETVRRINYAAAPTKKTQLEKLEEEISEISDHGSGFMRKLEDKLLAEGKTAIPVLLNAFIKLKLDNEDHKGVGTFITQLLERITELDDPPIYNVIVEDPAGRETCRFKWFEMWWAGKLK